MIHSAITLPSGFTLNVEKLYSGAAVTEQDLEALKAAYQKAHEGIQEMRRTGVVRGHQSKDGAPERVLFTKLPYITEEGPNTPAVLERLERLQAHVKDRIDTVISFGVGGSYLGGKVLFDIHCGEFWNHKCRKSRGGFPKLFFSGQNVDARKTAELIRCIIEESRQKKTYRVLLLVISKSGSTIEPMVNFMVVQQALEEAGITVEVAAVTDLAGAAGETELHKVAVRRNWPMFDVPDGVGGRFSVFSEVGLVIAAVVGFPMREFLAGARAMDEACQSDRLEENPALLSSVLKYAAAQKYGRSIEVFMPYGDCLKSLGEWYVQLLAESLGKRLDREGNVIEYSRTPLSAVGTTDMHAQTQEHQEGRRNKIVQFVTIKNWEQELTVPNTFAESSVIHSFGGLKMTELLEAAHRSNAEALAEDGRFSADFILPSLTAFHLGELMYLLCLAIAYEGELANVDAFNQPGVEIYKRILKSYVADMKGERL